VLSARELLRAYAERTLSPAEVLRECLDRPDDFGAFAVRLRPDARAAERAWRDGSAGALCGVPVAVKALFDVARVETACGSPLLAGRVPARDAAAVARLREAGALIVGTTRTHQFAWGLSMVGPDGEPVTRNPHDPERMPGGSSGGSAVAVATGLAAIALGTDTGGSIRLPAAWCRVSGHKPTHGLVSLDGVWPLAPSLDHAGPLAATPADCALALEVLGRPAPQPLAREPRIGGAERLPAPERVAAAYLPLFCREALAVHRRAGLWPRHAAGYGDAQRRRLEACERVGDAEVAAAARLREDLRVEMEAVFAEVDLVRSPVAACGPPRFDERPNLTELVTPYVALQDLLGLPACALPDGTQLTGPRGADALVLAAAQVLA
jgi:aspartyl-tRNA(Asn)/glutamyl-tRNA(Gln) amidotransferase subunit A